MGGVGGVRHIVQHQSRAPCPNRPRKRQPGISVGVHFLVGGINLRASLSQKGARDLQILSIDRYGGGRHRQIHVDLDMTGEAWLLRDNGKVKAVSHWSRHNARFDTRRRDGR